MNLRTYVAATALTLSVSAYADILSAPEIKGVVKGGTPIHIIKEDFKGTEGPIALPDGSLIFTENQADRIAHIKLDDTTSTYLENPNGPNGLAFNGNKELVAALTKNNPGIGVIYPADKVRTLVTSYQGKPLNRPNDLVVDKKGGVYFTDPGANPQPGETPVTPAFYYLNPNGKLLLLGNDVARPNGIQLSRDEKTLYVANTRGEHVLAYDIAADGSVSNKRSFAKLEGFKQNDAGVWASGADGLAIDSNGNLYVASSSGVQVFDEKGASLGIIPLPKSPQNLAFAGKDGKTLYIVGRGTVYKVATVAQAFKGRVK
jgi:gluconolactonase